MVVSWVLKLLSMSRKVEVYLLSLVILSFQAMWLCGGLNSFNRRVKNRTPATTPSNHYYHYRSKPRASKQTH